MGSQREHGAKFIRLEASELWHVLNCIFERFIVSISNQKIIVSSMSITQKYCSLVTNNLIVSVASNHECLILAHVTLCKASRCYGPRSSHFGTQTVTVATPTSAAGFHDSEKKRLVKHGPASSFYSYVMCRGFHIISILIFLAIVKDMTI